MFSLVHSDYNSGGLAGYLFDINFPHLVGDFNTFVAYRGYQNTPVNFNINPNSPVTNLLNGVIVDPNKIITLTTLAFYGYTLYCPDYTL
jgi:hypothetical protein